MILAGDTFDPDWSARIIIVEEAIFVLEKVAFNVLIVNIG